MPLRGESVGTAYVRVLADGTGLPNSIRDEFDRADHAFDDAGSASAKRYKKAFTEEVENFDHDQFGRRLDDAFNKALINDEQVQAVVNGPAFKKLERNLVARFGDIGQKEADALRDRFLRSGSIQGMENDVERITRTINQRVDRDMAASMREFETNFRRIMNETDRLSTNVSRSFDKDMQGLSFRLEQTKEAFAEFFSNVFIGLRDFHSETKKVDRDGSIFSRFAVTIDHMAEGVGRAFGKGSRNDALNFFGAVVTGGVKLLGLVPRLIGNLSEFGSGFRRALADGEGFFGSVSGGFTRMAKDAEGGSTAISGLVSSGLASLPLLAIAILGVGAVLGPIASLVTGLTGAVIALASSISFGLIAAAAALGPVLVALAGGIGVAILAIKEMDTQSAKAFKQGVTQFTNGLKDLGDTAREGFLQTFNSDLENLTNKLAELNPLVEAFGEGLGRVANKVVDGLNSPTLTRFLNQFTKFVPDALAQIGDIAGNVTAAVLAIFTDSIPLARRFLKFLDDATGDFQTFITSNPGKVTQFLSDAADSAKQIGDFLGAASRVIGDLLFSQSGKQAGDNIFGSLTDNLNTFDRFLDKHPHAMADFFANGQDVAKQIGNLAVNIGKLTAALDSPDSQRNLNSFLTFLNEMGKAAPAIALVSEGGGASLIGLGAGISAVIAAVESGGHIPWDKIGHGIMTVAQAVAKISDIHIPDPHLGDRIKDFFSGFGGGKGFNGKIGTLSINTTGVVNWIPGAIAKIRGFVGNVGQAFADLPGKLAAPLSIMRSRLGAAVDAMAREVATLPGRLSALAGQFAAAASRWAASLLARVSDIPGQIVSMFTGLAGRIISAIGSITIPIHFDIPNLPNVPGLHNPFTAAGGVFDKASVRVIGEAGREAVVPLDRPLSQIDPSVRWMAAMLRGQGTGGAPVTPGKTINADFTINTPTTDVEAVAHEVVNQLVAVGY